MSGKKLERTKNKTLETLRARLAEIATTKRDLDVEETSVRAAVDALEKIGGEKSASEEVASGS